MQITINGESRQFDAPLLLSALVERLELAGKVLEFREPEAARYPLLGLAYDAVRSGEGATVAYNAADEIAVEFFERGLIGYLDIARIVDAVLERSWPRQLTSLDAIGDLDIQARETAREAAIHLASKE